MRTQFANPEGELRPGQFVRVQLRGAVRPNSILVPQRALLQGAKGHYVWIVDKDGKAARREVEIGDWQGDGLVHQSGPVPGERVVVDGAIRLSPGAIVKVIDSSAPLSAASRYRSYCRYRRGPRHEPAARRPDRLVRPRRKQWRRHETREKARMTVHAAMKISHFCIDRPVFASVLSIVITLAGAVAML